jgi:hypothetical protein
MTFEQVPASWDLFSAAASTKVKRDGRQIMFATRHHLHHKEIEEHEMAFAAEKLSQHQQSK